MKTYLRLLLALLIGTTSIHAQTYTIYPVPQKMTVGDKTLNLTSDVNVVIGTAVNEQTKDRLEEVLANAGMTVSYADKTANGKTNILVGVNNQQDVVSEYLDAYSLTTNVFEAAANKFDPYFLQVNSNHRKGDILILGDEAGSAYYAMATLEQLLEQREAGALQQVTFEDYAYTEYRGIVEGFYGRPYTVENRLSLLDYCKRYKMNVYVYGPKSDPYHLGKWREDYPLSLTEKERYFGLITQDDIRDITAKAKASHVMFVWAAHPAMQNGISFSSESAMNPGIDAIMTKFDHLYDLGMRGFGIFIDDINYAPSGAMQAYLADQAQKKLREKYGADASKEPVSPLFFVPTAYALNYGGSGSLNSLKSVDQEVVIAFTGYDCFSNIRGSACQDMANRVGRNAVMWWNNPVNDDHDDRIYMREMTCHWNIEDKNPIPSLHGLIMNPMNQGQASKVSLFGAADYSWNPAKFDTGKNWAASFSSIIRNNEELEAALKTFAQSSNALIEEENLKGLYTSFKATYSKGKMPSATDELIREMQKINSACVLLRSLKTSSNKDDVLLYEDIRCWIDKLESMTGMIVKSLNLMKNEGNLDSWTDYADVQKEYQKLHTDSAFLVSSFEGSGTDTYEKFYEVHPSQTNMEPFLDYLIDKLSEYSLQLPEKLRTPEVITNTGKEDALVLTETDGRITVSGLGGFQLASGKYAGICLNTIKNATVGVLPASLIRNFAVEYSINGKEWFSFVPDGSTAIEMAYVRIKNIDLEEKVIPVDELAVNFPSGASITPINVSTNMSVYSTYKIEHVIDQDYTTFFWKDGTQAVNDYVTLDYGVSAQRYEIVLHFNRADYVTGTALLQLSDNNKDWETVSTFTSSDLSGEYVYSCNANGKSARYVRLLLQSVYGGNWFQLAEFEVAGVKNIPIACDDKDNPVFTLDDRSLATYYKAKDAGYVVYRFIENIKIDEIQIFHHSAFVPTAAKPTIKVFADGKWTEAGELDASCTKLDVSELKNISSIRIEWNKDNIPNLYEILPVGEKYMEEDGPIVQIEKVEEAPKLAFFKKDRELDIESSQLIRKVTVRNAFGINLDEVSVNNTSVLLPMGNQNQILLVGVTMEDGSVVVRKVACY